MSVRSDIKKLIKKLISEGWHINHGKHFKAIHPKGGFVVISITPSCHHAYNNILGDINRLKRQHGEVV